MLCKRISLSCVKVYWTLKYHKEFLKMGACDTWNVEVDILVYENEMFSLPAEFRSLSLSNILDKIYERIILQQATNILEKNNFFNRKNLYVY